MAEQRPKMIPRQKWGPPLLFLVACVLSVMVGAAIADSQFGANKERKP